MGEHHHHWVLIDGFTNAYSCCECGATRGDKRVIAQVRPVHSRRLLAGLSRRARTASHRAA